MALQAALSVTLVLVSLGYMPGPSEGSPSPSQHWFSLDVRCSWDTVNWTCRFTVSTEGLALTFFLFDFDSDGRWDIPDQAGASPEGRWTTELVVWSPVRTGYRIACVEGTNNPGFSRTYATCSPYMVGGKLFVDGRLAFYSPPKGEAPIEPIVFGRIEIEGISARPVPNLLVGEGSTLVMAFSFNSFALNRKLGPGEHVVHIRGSWTEWGETRWGLFRPFVAAGVATLP